MSLSPEQSARYARHLAMPEIGEHGQEKLSASHVLLVGVGGLGSPAALYLVAAGVGRISLVDCDVVEPSNLQRQVLHFTSDLDRPKVESAGEKLAALNPHVKIHALRECLTRDNAATILAASDVVIDGTDNYESKFLIAEVCHAVKKPYVHAGISNFCGEVMTVIPGRTACYRCVFDQQPPESTASPRGPLGAVAGVVGAVQAIEAVKLLLGIGQLMTNRLLVFDALAMTFRFFTAERKSSCPLCGGSTGQPLPMSEEKP